MRKFNLIIATVLTACCLRGVALGQAQPMGPEFRINAYTDGGQYSPAVGADGSGNFVVVWSSESSSIAVRRFDGDGNALGSEFQVNTFTEFDAERPAIAVDASGAFTVVWQSSGHIFGRRFDSGGAPGSAFQVNTFTGASSSVPAIAAGSSAALVVWGNNGVENTIAGRRLDSSGAPLGTEFEIASTTLVGDFEPDVAVDSAGDFVVVWTRVLVSSYPDYGSDIFGRRVASTGALLGTEFQVNADTAGEQYEPAVAADGGGGFVVVWDTYRGAYNTTLDAQRLTGTGAQIGGGFNVTSQGQYVLPPDIAAEPGGGFVIAWSGECGYYCYDDPFARRYASSGAPLGDVFRLVSDETEFKQEGPAVAVSAAGRMFAVWHSDAFPYDVFGRLFATSVSSPICTAGAPADRALLKLGKLSAPAGNEKVTFKGRLPFPPGEPTIFNPAADGAQILIEDAGNANAVIFELSHRTIAVPPGAGCGPDDGWSVNGSGTTHTYKNRSGALPPGCAPGSANGLRLVKLKDKRARSGFIGFTVKVKNATLPAVTGPLRATIVTSASAAAGTAGACGGQVSPTCTVEPDKISCP